MYSGISKFLLLAIPFFVLSGNIMAKAGISKRLIRFVDTCVGHKKGGIAIVCVIVACFFGAISGSGPATVAALGMVLIPAMIERGGFSAPFSTALMATSSSIAIVIPPSIAFVVYASITGVSIADMFTAGIVPGILMGVALVIVVLLEAKKHNIQPTQKKATAKERWDAFKDAFWGFLMPVIILGGIYSGMLTATESAAIAVVWAAIAGLFIYKELTVKELVPILKDSAKSSAMILFIIAASTAFSWVFTFSGASQALVNAVISMHLNSALFCFVVAIILLIFGTFMEGTAIAVLLVPVLWPIAQSMGIDVIHFGMIVCISNVVGTMTPPVAVNIFSASTVSGLKMGDIAKAEIPFLIGYVAVFFCCVFSETFCTFLI